MIVLDTNVVSELMRGRPDDGVLAWLDAQSVEELHLVAVTVAELRYGVERLPAGARRQALDGALTTMLDDDFEGRVLPFDRAAAEWYATIVVDRDRRGRPISHADAEIAAICRVHRATLATRNVRDFQHTAVTTIDPWSAPPES